MATPRRSVVLVVLGVLAAAAAGSYYFFFVFTRDEALHEAQAQVAEWEARWRTARTCLVGETPLAAELDDALTAYELLREDGAPTDCSREMGKLVRPEGNASTLEAVEVAWEQLEDAGTAAAKRYVSWRSSSRDQQAPLVEALQRLRKARATLRRVVELSMEDAPMGPALRELELAALQLEGQPITELAMAGAGADLVGRLSAGGRWYQGRLVRQAGKLEVRATAVAPDVVASAPDGGWGIAAAFDERKPELMRLSAGALDAQGALTAAVELVRAPPSLFPAAALGQGAERAALYVTSTQEDAALHISQSSDAGKTWRTTPLPWLRGNVFADGAGTADAVAQVSESALVWQRGQAAQLPRLAEPVRWPGVELVAACPAPSAPWALVRRTDEGTFWLARMDQLAAPTPIEDRVMSKILDCDDRSALLGDPGTPRVLACVGPTCTALAVRPDEGFAVVVDGKPYVATVLRALLAMKSPVAPRRLARLPAGTTVQGVYALAGATFVVVKRGSGELWGGTLP